MPIYTWHGGDFRRYMTNGWPYLHADYFDFDGPDGQFFRRTAAIGPLNLNGTTRFPLALVMRVPTLPASAYL